MTLEHMHLSLPALSLIWALSASGGTQSADTLTLKYFESKYDSTVFRRTVEYDRETRTFHVTDRFLSGQLALQGDYLAIDPSVKEEFWNYHRTHIKHGDFKKWYANGQLEWEGRFEHGLIHGKATSWHHNGRLHYTGEYRHGMQHGSFTYFDENGGLRYGADFDHGRTLRPARVRYDYLAYLPKAYEPNATTQWPVIIFLHGGSSRGNDLKRVKANGIPDRLERGKDLPFVVIAPQCPIDKRWETDEWFDLLYAEITTRYHIDTNRIYLTGFSLGGSGTWHLAIRHPTRFAAIAPISGRTLHSRTLSDSACALAGTPIYIFHGTDDEIVDIHETYQITKRLDQCNVRYSLSILEGHKHWQTQWEVYGGDEIYGWFLRHRRRPAP